MQKFIGIGRLTKDPENTTVGNDTSLTKFTIAIQRKFKNSDGEYDADFINCTAWRKTADFISKYFEKGQKIAVVGSIQVRSYETQDGSKKYATDVVVDEAEFVEKKSNSEPKKQEIDETDDFPF